MTDMRSVHRYVTDHIGSDAKNIHFVGHSLGTGISVALANELCSAKSNKCPGSITLIAPFTNALDASTHFPLTRLFLWPVSFVLPTWTGINELSIPCY